MSAIPDSAWVSLSTTYCCHDGCGAAIILPREIMQSYRDNHKFFYCYKGHDQHFAGESDKEKLKKQLASQKKRTEWAQQEAKRARECEESAQRRAAAYKGVVTKTKKRIKNGVCPCCNRTFANLARHMKSKHPKYGKGKKAR
jgi:anthranilate/para-aminobenzoate synthase component I